MLTDLGRVAGVTRDNIRGRRSTGSFNIDSDTSSDIYLTIIN